MEGNQKIFFWHSSADEQIYPPPPTDAKKNRRSSTVGLEGLKTNGCFLKINGWFRCSSLLKLSKIVPFLEDILVLGGVGSYTLEHFHGCSTQTKALKVGKDDLFTF